MTIITTTAIRNAMGGAVDARLVDIARALDVSTTSLDAWCVMNEQSIRCDSLRLMDGSRIIDRAAEWAWVQASELTGDDWDDAEHDAVVEPYSHRQWWPCEARSLLALRTYVLKQLTDAGRGLMRTGVYLPIAGGSLEHGRLRDLQLVEKDGRQWRATNLGREISRVLRRDTISLD